VHVWDNEGREYIDLIQGVAVHPLGHAHPEVVRAMREQISQVVHVSNLFDNPTQMQLAAELVELSGLSQVFFANSGTEATEGALKFVRKYWYAQGQTERIQVVSFGQSFHGRTYGSLSATGQVKLQTGFGPLLSGFTCLDINQPELLEQTLSSQTAAVILEPILAEGGVITPDPAFVELLFKLREQYGFLIIADEVQTAFHRTGPFWGSQNWPGTPDLITLAKPLGGGLPLGAVLVSQDIAAAVKPGDHGSTFGGNPVACAAGLALLKVLKNPGFAEACNESARYFRQKLLSWVMCHPDYFTPTLLGKGWIIGIPALLDLNQFQKCCRQEGLLIHRAGTQVIRLLPPVNLATSLAEPILQRLQSALNHYKQMETNHEKA